MFRSIIAYSVLLVPVLFFAGCNNDDDDNRPPVSQDPLTPQDFITTSISGEVVDESGSPIPGVAVHAYGRTAYSDEQGAFYLDDVVAPDQRCVVSCTKTGFFASIRTVKPTEEGTSYLQFIMMSDATTHTVLAETGGIAELSNGSSVTFAPNSLVLPSGQSYTGMANLSIRYLDSSLPGFSNLVPGGDMLARRTDQSPTILYSYGILRVLITTPSGENLQLASGKPAIITVKIPEAQLTTAPNTIPLWFFDEDAGFWKEEGKAVKEGDVYVGQVAHFTDWNCDDPNETATIIGKVVDCTGQPVITGQVFVGQSSSDLRNGISIDNSTGSGNETSFTINVPARMPLFVAVPKPFTIISGEGGDLVMIAVPPLRPRQIFNVGTITPHPCPTSISGTFVLKPSDAIESVSFRITNQGNSNLSTLPQRIHFSQTVFKFSGFPALVTLSMEVKTKEGIQVSIPVQTPEAGKNIHLGDIVLDNSATVTVHSVVSCGNTPVNGASVKFQWPNGSATTSTDNVGVFGIALPAGKTVTMKIEHALGTLSRTFTVPSVAVHNLGVSDVCN